MHASVGAPPDAAPSWHTLSEGETIALLGVDPQEGLSSDEVALRAARFGPNAIEEQRRRGVGRMLLDQFTDVMIVVLIVAAVISGLIGEPEDAIAIAVIVVLNGVIGFVQEYRAERAVAALRLLAAPQATVRRDGQVSTVAASRLVPGDLVLLETGNLLPADVRLLEAVNLKVDESALTGESVPVEKRTAELGDPELSLGDRLDMAYKGTLVTYGRGTAVVVATGMSTELGKIATLLSQADQRQTPLQQRLAQFGRRLAYAAIAICVVIFAVGLMRGESVTLMFLTSVSLAVAAIPEALPAVVTVSLALGARRMVRHHALIRRLPAVETLGSVTYVCTDKTGTLTENSMCVEQLYAGGDLRNGGDALDGDADPWRTLYTALALSNDATRNDRGDWIGDPTEIALYAAAAEAGLDRTSLDAAMPRVAEVPFDSERKSMTTFHQSGAGVLSFTKGAPERIIERSAVELRRGGPAPLDPDPILARAEQMAADGLRVLAVGCRSWPCVPGDLAADVVECGLAFVGLVGLMDPPRPEARNAVAECRSAGITPVMVTGDHPATARAVAMRLGISAAGDTVITGPELARLSPEALEERVEHIRVYARVAPEQKITIVKALQDRGQFVAMTGDGVNDAPALKRADIGVAMGIAGTDVAREAADMILLDDNFATIVAAVREGRRIFDNTRKFIRYAVTCNSGEIWTIFLAPFLGLPIPLLPIHILWINLVTDGLPGLALAAEPHEEGIMRRPPRPPDESLFAHGMWQHIIWVGLLMGGVSLLTQAIAYHNDDGHWQTMVFTVLALSQMGHVLAIRSERQSLFSQGLGSNPPLLGAASLTLVLQLLTIYVPAAHPVFKTQALTATELVLCLAVSTVVFVAVEIEKWLVRHGRLYRSDAFYAKASRPAP